MLDNEFGTHVDEDVIKQILEKGDLKESKVSDQLLFFFQHNLDITIFAVVDVSIQIPLPPSTKNVMTPPPILAYHTVGRSESFIASCSWWGYGMGGAMHLTCVHASPGPS